LFAFLTSELGFKLAQLRDLTEFSFEVPDIDFGMVLALTERK
jgi:hypothetical protein